jgi:lysozyme family protein
VDSEIEDILNGVLEREGWPEYVDHPQDRGGPTKGGITLRTLNQWRHHQVNRQELQRLEKSEALHILERRYVDSNGIGKIPDKALRVQVIDSAVLSGPVLSAKDLQRVLEVTMDGIIGPKTLAALSDREIAGVRNGLAVVRSLRLVRFTQHHPEQLVFLTGWLNRSLSFVS